MEILNIDLNDRGNYHYLREHQIDGVPHNVAITCYRNKKHESLDGTDERKFAVIADLINLNTREKKTLMRTNRVFEDAFTASVKLNKKLKEHGFHVQFKD